MPLKMLIILAVVALVAVSFGLAEPALASSGGAACPGSRRFSRFSSPSPGPSPASLRLRQLPSPAPC